MIDVNEKAHSNGEKIDNQMIANRLAVNATKTQ